MSTRSDEMERLKKQLIWEVKNPSSNFLQRSLIPPESKNNTDLLLEIQKTLETLTERLTPQPSIIIHGVGVVEEYELLTRRE